MYPISDLTKKRAREIGVEVRPSTDPKKKIDVFSDGEKVASIGDITAKDYHIYLKEKGQSYANERKRLYHLRHTRESLGEYLSRWLLWM
jgi:hypothetical protein